MKELSFSKVLAIISVVMLISAAALAGPLPKPASTNPEVQKLIDEAWQASRTEINVENYNKCISLLEKATKIEPNNETVLNGLAHCYWQEGDLQPKGTKEQSKVRDEFFAKGIAAAENSLKIKESVGGHYWLATNKAASLESQSIFSQAAGFWGIKKNSDWVSDHDPQYFYGAVGRLWSEVLSRVPKKVVELVGWDVQEAVDEINNAIKIEPRFIKNYEYKARFYHVYFNNDDEALKLLDYVLKQDPNIMPDEAFENRFSQQNARELWKKITGKEYPAK